MIGVAGPLAFDAPKIFWQIIVAIGGALTVLSSAFLIYEYRDLVRRRRMVPLTGMIVTGILFVAFAGWYFWPGKTEAHASPLDGTIQIAAEMAQYPTVVPQHQVFELQLNNHFSMEGGGFLVWTYPAGTTLPTRDPAVFPSTGSRLRITNYGKTAIVNARVTFPIVFRAAEKTDNGTKSGGIIKSTSLTTLPFSIGPGEIVDVYAMNYSTDAFATILIPQTADGFAVGSDKQETFKLIPSMFAGSAFPFVPKSPPAARPAVPLPQDTQAKK